MRAWRRQYTDVVGDKLRRADLGGLVGLARRWVGTVCSPRARRPLAGPALGTLLVTYRCNLACRVCDLPQRAIARRRAGDRELDTSEMRAVLRDFRAIGTLGLGVTGGEPMLREDLVDLLGYGASLGLHVHLNTDGVRVDDGAARALIAAGVRSVNVSLDGATATEHDAVRGRAGAFDDAVRALGALARARRSARDLRLTAVTVLTHRNVDQVAEVCAAALEAGADRLGVIPVHDFGQGEAPADPGRVARGLNLLEDLRARGVLDNSRAYLALLPRALRGEPSPLRCWAPYASVVVDCYGDVFPCFPYMERRRPLGRLPLAPLWRSEAYQRERERLASCTACLWNCHTEMNLVLPQGRAGSALWPAPLAQVTQGPAPHVPASDVPISHAPISHAPMAHVPTSSVARSHGRGLRA